MRISSQPGTRWPKKQQHVIPGISSGCKASRAVGRPRKRWEDDINQFLKLEETEETKGNELKNNDTWMQVAKDQRRGKFCTRSKSERC